jgi:hypothetical protein
MPVADNDIIQMEPHQIKERLLTFNKKVILPGIVSPARLDCLVNQVMDSIQRINRITEIRNTVHSTPANDDFNPLIAAAYHQQQGNIDEAFWLVFLATHFGEEEITKKWNHVRNVYHAFGNAPYWTWEKTSNDSNGFRRWLQSNKDVLQQNGRFGNHRKYESLLDEHTGKTIASYIDWIGEKRGHQDLFNYMRSQVGAHPHILFDALYKSMEVVWRFGRTSKFDYLCMVGKLGLTNIRPGHPYLQDATGPLEGARLLFGNRIADTQTLNLRLRELGLHLNLYYIHQVLEDAVCNWQKSPDTFISFLTQT